MSGDKFVFSSETGPTTPPPGKPPDSGGCSMTNPCPPPMSFRDKVMGNSQVTPAREKKDLIKEKLITIVHEHGNRLLPKVTLDKSIFQELCNPWKDSLVIKLLGKSLGYNMMKDKLKRVWKTAGGFDILDIDNGFYMVKFDVESDRERALSDGPWMIYDHYLAVSRWTPEFVSPEAKVDRTTVWIRFPGLNLVYYDESVLLALASAVGKPVKVDTNTLKVQRGRFARICVEIDLNQPVVGKVWVDGYWYKVSYEGLHIICSQCGCYGHLGRNCKAPPQNTIPPSSELSTTPEPNNDGSVTEVKGKNHDEKGQATPTQQDTGKVHGDWLVVTRKKRTVPPPKDTNKSNAMVHLSNSFEKLNTFSNVLGHVGSKGKGAAFNASAHSPTLASPCDSRTTKSGWKVKKRRHEEGIVQQIVPTALPKVNATKSTSIPQKKETSKNQKELGPTTQAIPTVRTPLQESSKQNIITSLAGYAQPEGYRTTMPIEQVGQNHFRFSEENKPPDSPVDNMVLGEDEKGTTSKSFEGLMQEDSEMGLEDPVISWPPLDLLGLWSIV